MAVNILTALIIDAALMASSTIFQADGFASFAGQTKKPDDL